MQPPYNDRWERTKRYLLRNFLVNPGFDLSPIPEEERSSPDGSSSSSLPDLVIEREPNRHDDSDAFYEDLERRMKRYYRQLFLGQNVDEDEDSLDFEVNRSMTSTFIEDSSAEYEVQNAATEKRSERDENSVINERQFRDLTNEFHGDDVNNINTTLVSEQIDTATNERTQLSIDRYKETDKDFELIKTPSGNFKIINTVIDPDIQEVNDDKDLRRSNFEDDSLNIKARDSIADASNNKSDTDDSTPCHRVSTTVVEVHEPRPQRMLTRVFEDGSPVLMPRFIKFGRSLFGSRIRYINQSSLDDLDESGGTVERKLSQNYNKSEAQEGNIEEETENDESEQVNIDQEAEGAEGESESIDKETENVEETEYVEEETESEEEETTVQRLLTDSEITNVSQDSSHSDVSDDDETIENDRNELNVHDKSEHTIEDQSQTRITEESIGPDEFNYTAIDTIKPDTQNPGWEDESNDSFENVLRKGVFESKNNRKTSAQSTDEDMESSDENLEPVEEVRGAREVGVNASLVRESAGTEGSPVPAFGAKTSAEKLEEVSSDSEGINAQVEKEPNEPHDTPNPRTTVNALDDFWSVSPIQVDVESNNDLSRGSKRKRPEDEASRKKRKDVATQARASARVDVQWEDIRANFFVGSPVVLQLCGCPDHVCPK